MKVRTNYSDNEMKGSSFDPEITEEGEYGIMIEKIRDPKEIGNTYLVFAECFAFAKDGEAYPNLKRAPALSFEWDNEKGDFRDSMMGRHRWMKFVKAIDMDEDDAVDTEAFEKTILICEYRNKQLKNGATKLLPVNYLPATDSYLDMATSFM